MKFRLRLLPICITIAFVMLSIKSYDLGVNSYIRKPVTFNKLVEVVKALGRYWFEIVDLPPS